MGSPSSYSLTRTLLLPELDTVWICTVRTRHCVAGRQVSPPLESEAPAPDSSRQRTSDEAPLTATHHPNCLPTRTATFPPSRDSCIHQYRQFTNLSINRLISPCNNLTASLQSQWHLVTTELCRVCWPSILLQF